MPTGPNYLAVGAKRSILFAVYIKTRLRRKGIMPPQRRQQLLPLLQELIKCGDDHRFNLLQADLKHLLHTESGRLPNRGFIKRYICGDASLHIHGWLRLGKYALDFCAMLQAATGKADTSMNCSQDFASNYIRDGHVKMAVFVNVRECSKRSERTRGVPTIVRLDRFNECKRRFGNTRKNNLKAIVDRRSLRILEPLAGISARNKGVI